MRESERCSAARCAERASTSLAGRSFCRQHFIPTCYARLEEYTQFLQEPVFQDAAYELVRQFVRECVQQAALALRTKDLDNLERWNLLDIVFWAGELGNRLRSRREGNYDPWAVAAEARTADRWRSAAAGWNSALTEGLLDSADLHQNSFVLDVAAGSGDPALCIAQRVSEGSVVALDSSRSALLLAKRQADDLGLGSKLGFVQADAHKLPFSDSSFDRVTCRCGIMFFADVDAALTEMLRVLKVGGRAASLVWGPFEQPFFDGTVGAILRLVPGTTIPEPARAIFRFATGGSIQKTLCRAGFRNVQEQHVTFPRTWAGSSQQLWEYFQEISTPFRPLIQAIPEALRPRVDEAVCSALARFQSGNTITVPAQLVLATAER